MVDWHFSHLFRQLRTVSPQQGEGRKGGGKGVGWCCCGAGLQSLGRFSSFVFSVTVVTEHVFIIGFCIVLGRILLSDAIEAASTWQTLGTSQSLWQDPGRLHSGYVLALFVISGVVVRRVYVYPYQWPRRRISDP